MEDISILGCSYTFLGKCAPGRDLCLVKRCCCSAHVIAEFAKQMATGLMQIIMISFCQVGIGLEQGCQSQMDGGPNKKFSYKPRAGLFECSLKNF